LVPAERAPVELKTEALVYPSVEPTADYSNPFPACRERWKASTKGRGQDLYALRITSPRQCGHVHWKASARTGSLMVREFTREDDCRILLVLDPHLSAEESSSLKRECLRRASALSVPSGPAPA